MCIEDIYKKKVKVIRTVNSVSYLEDKINNSIEEMAQDNFVLTDIKYNSIDIGTSGREAIEYSAICIYAHVDVIEYIK